MKILLLFIVVCTVYGSLVSGLQESYPDSALVSDRSQVTYNYDRTDEVKKHCISVLSSATELRAESDRIYRIRDEVNFVFGDWEQEMGIAPIMPFDDSDVRKDSPRTPEKIASFWVMDVDRDHRSKKYVGVSGELYMGITLDESFAERPYGGNPQFQMWPNHTQLTMTFQGIYTESKKNGGEIVLCLLGTAMLPSRESESNNPWEWMKGSGPSYYQPPLLQDDQILLVLHFPLTFTLTNMVIKGEMSSLNPKSNPKYFDKVHILSQHGRSARYEFGTDKIVSKACNPYPVEDSFMKGGIDIYKGIGFCEVLQQVTNEGAFTVVPNWKCNGTDNFCSKMGPFGLNKEIQATDGSFKDVKIFMQNVKCEQTHGKGNSSSAKVAAVFRAAPPSAMQYAATLRSGISNMTLAAEGLWKSSSGQLCMVGCVGLVNAEGSSCNSQICMYIPTSFSIKQRSIIVGSFSSINKSSLSYFPLAFEKFVQPTELWNYFRTSNPHYSYSKIDKAGIVLEKNEPFSFGTIVKKSLLQFPRLEDADGLLSSLSLLSEDLTLHISAIPDPLPKARLPRTDIQMEIISLGPLFGHYWSSRNFSTREVETHYHTKAEYTEKQLLLNVSAQLSITEKSYSNFSVLFLEGLYDPHVGKMYLVGCRDVRASWKILFDSMDLEAGLDCLIEVVVSYPPTTSRWLVNPTAKIYIASQRNDDDPLHFKTIKFQTLPVMYRKQREDILSRRGVEGILRIVTLSFAIACILSQLFYIKHNLDSNPFMSLVMLGVQALGYSLPLITGAEALFKRKDSEYQNTSYNLEKNQWFQVIDYTVKLLVMVSFLLTLRLMQKVWKSRVRLLSRSPNEPHRVPSDKLVLLTTSAIHVTGYILVLIIHSAIRTEKFIDSTSKSMWETELEEYVGLVQDFFLLPQVIGNFLWQTDCKPLRKLYFIGITVVRLLPHVYDYTRSPVPNPYFSDEYEFANPNLDFYSKFGDVAIPITAVFLAAAVYIQQKLGYEKLSQILTFGHYKLLPSRSRTYERLPSKAIEAELASDVNGNTMYRRQHDDDDEE
ncbi:PII uridylyltransferase [Citrus sinensis]|uniref:PII uridylyltransferase n=1 Tax=Citrus sinensis TaxID=2711 RepID=A0ACB8JAR8_CITSI|nr:PII uridylyltransferase [Citrus sinensis]